MKPDHNFSAIRTDEGLTDIETVHNGRQLRMLGSGGPAREIEAVKQAIAKGGLTVLLGAGMGAGLRYARENAKNPVAVVDVEPEARKLAGLANINSSGEVDGVCWITEENVPEALARLTEWQTQNGGKPMNAVPFHFYQRLRPEYYGEIRKSLDASAGFDFWQKAHSPRFTGQKPRVLLLASKYFLIGEIERACKKLDLPYKLLMVGEGDVDMREFVKSLLEAAVTFQPDCAITLNHMGVDREGVLMDMLAKLRLPLASWFVDNPHLIVHSYNKVVSPWTTLFTWDEDNVRSLQALGFEHVRYLPLGTDTERFRPGLPGPAEWRGDVSFVGNSMIQKVSGRLKHGHFSKPLLKAYKEIAAAFATSEERNVGPFIKAAYPAVWNAYLELPDNEDRLAYETAITWQATRIYRNGCVEKLLPFKPLIVGDDAWRSEFRKWGASPRLLPAISYYSQLPAFYSKSHVNFNCTSKQMKGSVNQRVFDVPAAGGFVLTDWRPQLANLFEEDEMACFREESEIAELVRYFLDHPAERKKYVQKARKRVLAHHKWEDRVSAMLKAMSEIYGTQTP